MPTRRLIPHLPIEVDEDGNLVRHTVDEYVRQLFGTPPRTRRTPEEVRKDRERMIGTPDSSRVLQIDAFAEIVEDHKRGSEKGLEKLSRQVIQTASREAVLSNFANEKVRQVFWMCVSDASSCDDCLYLHGTIMGLDEFKARYGKTRCDGNCRCQPLAAAANDYREMAPLEKIREMQEGKTLEERAEALAERMR